MLKKNISVKLKRKTTLVNNGSSVIFSNLNNFLTIDILKSFSECNDRRKCDMQNFFQTFANENTSLSKVGYERSVKNDETIRENQLNMIFYPTCLFENVSAH